MRIAILDLTKHPLPLLSGICRAGKCIEDWISPSFSGSIIENITMGREGISQDEIIAASKISGLDDFLGKMPVPLGPGQDVLGPGRGPEQDASSSGAAPTTSLHDCSLREGFHSQKRVLVSKTSILVQRGCHFIEKSSFGLKFAPEV